jgi:hypothetical protein
MAHATSRSAPLRRHQNCASLTSAKQNAQPRPVVARFAVRWRALTPAGCGAWDGSPVSVPVPAHGNPRLVDRHHATELLSNDLALTF